MKLSEWAKLNGIGYRTAWNWFKNGTLPVKAIQSKTGTIIIQMEEAIDQSLLMHQILLCEALLLSLKSQSIHQKI